VEDFVLQVGPALRRFILAHCRTDLAEEAYQETLLAIATRLGRCMAGSDAQVWRWCYQVARNKIADQARRAGGTRLVSLEVESVQRAVGAIADSDEGFSSEKREELEYALDLLRAVKPPCVDYLWEAIALNLTYEAVGELHGLRRDAARMQVNRCLELAQALVRKKAMVNYA
jgi:RNA polymerase sigma factor (sigma-70 family)